MCLTACLSLFPAAIVKVTSTTNRRVVPPGSATGPTQTVVYTPYSPVPIPITTTYTQPTVTPSSVSSIYGQAGTGASSQVVTRYGLPGLANSQTGLAPGVQTTQQQQQATATTPLISQKSTIQVMTVNSNDPVTIQVQPTATGAPFKTTVDVKGPGTVQSQQVVVSNGVATFVGKPVTMKGPTRAAFMPEPEPGAVTAGMQPPAVQPPAVQPSAVQPLGVQPPAVQVLGQPIPAAPVVVPPAITPMPGELLDG